MAYIPYNQSKKGTGYVPYQAKAPAAALGPAPKPVITPTPAPTKPFIDRAKDWLTTGALPGAVKLIGEKSKEVAKNMASGAEGLVKGEFSPKEVAKTAGNVGLKTLTDVAPEIIRSPLRFATEATATTLGQAKPLKFNDIFGEKAGPVISQIYGRDEVRPFGKQVETGRQVVEVLGGTPKEKKYLPYAFIGIGGIMDFYAKPVKAVFTEIAKETSEEAIKATLKREIKDLSDEVATKWSKDLTKITNPEVVESYVSKEVKKLGEKAVDTLPKNGQYVPFDSSKTYKKIMDRNGEAFMKGHTTGDSGFGFGSAVSAEEKAAALERSKQMIKELQSTPDPLLQEARKYKSAEEFVNKQSKVYHGTNVKNADMIEKDFRILSPEEHNKFPTTVVGDTQIGLSTSRDKGIADYFNSLQPTGKGKTVELYLSPKTKIYKLPDGINAIDELGTKKLQELKKQGYDAIEDVSNIGGESEIRILNSNVALTKSQLTDLWNKANKSIDDIPLPKTAEEFDALPFKQQDEVFSKLPESLQYDIMGYDKAAELKNQLDDNDYINQIASGKVKLRVPKNIKEEVMYEIGQGNYTRIFRNDPRLSPVDEAASIAGLDLDVFLERLGKVLDNRRELKTRLINERRRLVADRRLKALAIKDEKAKASFLKNISRDITRELTKKRYSALQRVKFESRAVAKGEKLGAKSVLNKTQSRKQQIEAVQDFFKLTDKELRQVQGRSDIRLMSDKEFEGYLEGLANKAQLYTEQLEAKEQLMGTIFEKEFKKVDNLRKALKLPTIKNMTIPQMKEFDKLLQEFKQGDEFLGVRQIETVNNTDLAGIKTMREARESLAKKYGVDPKELESIKVNELDRYRYDTSLARRNPFYDMMVDEKNLAMLNANAGILEIRKEISKLINNARKSRPRTLTEKVIPTDKKIFEWLESPDARKVELAREMTSAELKAAERIREIYADARDYLVQQGVLKKYRTDYITHIRRGFLESWKDDGLISAFKEAFEQYKLDEAYFNILDQKTGEILPLEKFFQFSMSRSGALKPTKNVADAVLAYFSAFEKKKALDSLVPKIDIYAHSLTPRRMTPRGLEYDDSLKRFVKEWLNTKKGRPIDTFIKPGGKVDWTLRTGVALMRLLDLGLSVPLGVAASFGEQVTDFIALGSKNYGTGVKRLASSQGREIVKKYRNFTGETLIERLTDASASTGDKLLSTAFGLYSTASRKANEIFLLGSMTPEEFAKGAISTERLAKLQKEMGRYRVVDGFESIIGKTSIGAVGKQYKTWAVPILSSTLDNLNKLSKMWKSGGKAVSKSPEFQELLRATVLTSAIGLGLYGYSQELKDKKDRTFLEEIAYKATRDALTFIGALDPALWLGEPRLVSFLDDLGTAIHQILVIDRTKDGDLRGVNKLKQIATPSLIRQVSSTEEKEESSGLGGGLPKLPPLPKVEPLPKLPQLPKLWTAF